MRHNTSQYPKWTRNQYGNISYNLWFSTMTQAMICNPLSMQPIHIIIHWRIPSKKNSKRIAFNKKTGNRFIISSEKHEAWEKSALKLLPKVQVRTPAIIYCNFYFPDRRKCDLSNKFETIADILVKWWILLDDNWECLPTVNLRFMGVDKVDPRVVVIIQP